MEADPWNQRAKGERIPASGEVREMQAYDCWQPRQIQILQTGMEGQCCHNRATLRKKVGMRYLLLQEVPYSRIKIAKCKLTRNLIPLYYGNYDHQTLIMPNIWFNRPIVIGPEEYRRYHHDHELYC